MYKKLKKKCYKKYVNITEDIFTLTPLCVVNNG